MPSFLDDAGNAVERARDLANARQHGKACDARRVVALRYIEIGAELSQHLACRRYVDVSVVGAWCELRKDLRNIRVERIVSSRMLAARFQDHTGKLLAEWLALPKKRPASRL